MSQVIHVSVWARALLVVALWVSVGKPQTITTVAGTGIEGYSGDGGHAVNARLRFPSGVALDADNNLYIADLENHRIRRVDAVTGTITTVAGEGLPGYLGDGDPAIHARLYIPSGVALDADNNLYIADLENHCIRRVDAVTGVITTVAGEGLPGYSGDGGPAVKARLRHPGGVGIDSRGNLYIANDHCIRRVDAVTETITTVAGDCNYGHDGFSGDGGPAVNALLSGPTSIAVDAGDNLYIADFSNHCIRRVDAVSGVITTVAGEGGRAGVLVLPAGVAVDADGNLFIADSALHRIRRVDAVTGTITTVAGLDDGFDSEGFSGDGGPAVNARLARPLGVAVDVNGNLYIADTDNHRIRRVARQIVSSVAGEIEGQRPRTVALLPNIPNPFNAQTIIGYELPASSAVELTIYNLRGQPVRTLVAQRQPAGVHRAIWEGQDAHGRPVASGIYLCRLSVDDGRVAATRRMVLLK